jgi:uncharacterized protein (DUF488 family)
MVGFYPLREGSIMKIHTIGHSTRTHEEFFDMLAINKIELAVDVRSYPTSKFCPQWNRVEIEHKSPIDYMWLPILGGKRKPLPKDKTLNGAWRNASFRGYADYMQTQDFLDGIEYLISLAEKRRLAIFCSEAVWWKCHRSMIADALVSMDIEVRHIMSNTKCDTHELREFAVVGDTITYPGGCLVKQG